MQKNSYWRLKKGYRVSSLSHTLPDGTNITVKFDGMNPVPVPPVLIRMLEGREEFVRVKRNDSKPARVVPAASE